MVGFGDENVVVGGGDDVFIVCVVLGEFECVMVF